MRARSLIGVLALAAVLGCGSVGSTSKDAGNSKDGTATGAGGAATGAGGSGSGAGGTTGAGGATGAGGSTGAGGNASGIFVHGTIGTLGAPPAQTGAVRLVNPRISTPGPTICNTTTCLVNGGIVP